MKRIAWIDYAKAFCIFLVVLGHSNISLPIKDIIYVFHIPLFFFISGTLFSFDKYPDYLTFLKKRIYQLVIPYFFFNISTYLFWLIIGRKVGNDISQGLNPMKQFVGIFWGNDANHYLEHCAPLWFLACLFTVENLYYILLRHLNSNWVHRFIGILFFAILGYLDYRFNPTRFPWGLNVALVTIVFYGMGSLLRNITLNPEKISIRYYSLLTFISFLGVLLIARLNGKVEVSIGYYANYVYFIAGAMFGIVFIVSLSKITALLFGNNQLIQYIGKNTIIILGFHLLAGSFIKAFSFYLLKLPLSIYEFQWISLIYSIVSILLLLPVIYYMNHYLPKVIGKK